MSKLRYYIILFGSLCTLLTSCGDDVVPSPKQRGYFRITLPKEEYKPYHAACNFGFEIPKYAEPKPYERDLSRTCWFNLELKKLNATIHFSYYKNIKLSVGKYIEDSRALVYKHTMKAQYINEQYFSNSNKKVYAMMYELGGNAASPCQFYATDSSNHFIRGALYFNTLPNADSLAPVNQLLLKNVQHLLETIEWK